MKMQYCRITIWVQPGSRREGIVGWHGDALKVAVSAAPEKGKANRAVCDLLAAELGIRPSAISVTRGETSRRKELAIEGVDESRVAQLVSRYRDSQPKEKEQP
jgi:uncharacterized protein